MNGVLINETLERAARTADLQTRIYTLLFQRHPQFESLFALDTDNSVRGSMLQTALEYILLYTDESSELDAQLKGSCANHVGYGVEVSQFVIFFEAIRDCVAEICTTIWSNQHADEWDRMINYFNKIAPLDS